VLILALPGISWAQPSQEVEVGVKPPVTNDPLMKFIYRTAWVHRACLQRYPQQAALWREAEQQLLEDGALVTEGVDVDIHAIEPLSIQHCQYEMTLWSMLDRSDAYELAEFLEEVAFQELGEDHLESPQRLVLGLVFLPFGMPGVSELHPQGPAHQAGIMPLDQLLSVGGVRIASTKGFYVQMARAVPGRSLNVTWRRHSAQGTQQYEATMVPIPQAQLLPRTD
jgi:predicted metalloprotease with PDZ domain